MYRTISALLLFSFLFLHILLLKLPPASQDERKAVSHVSIHVET